MPYGLYISAEGALAQSTRLETISNNLANVGTAGFKRDVALFQARLAEEIERGQDAHGSGTLNNVGGGVQVRATLTDHSIGPLDKTDIPTDLAINGEGFFSVRKGDQVLLTRAGNFVFNNEGQLQTPEGYPVLDEAGGEVAIDPTGGPWQFDAVGGLQQAGGVQYLAVVQPSSLGDLVKAGENLFQPLGPTTPVEPLQRRVDSGWIERSGVKPTTEMMEMIEASRAFEANVNMIRNQDQMLGALVNRLLRTN